MVLQNRHTNVDENATFGGTITATSGTVTITTGAISVANITTLNNGFSKFRWWYRC